MDDSSVVDERVNVGDSEMRKWKRRTGFGFNVAACCIFPGRCLSTQCCKFLAEICWFQVFLGSSWWFMGIMDDEGEGGQEVGPIMGSGLQWFISFGIGSVSDTLKSSLDRRLRMTWRG